MPTKGKKVMRTPQAHSTKHYQDRARSIAADIAALAQDIKDHGKAVALDLKPLERRKCDEGAGDDLYDALIWQQEALEELTTYIEDAQLIFSSLSSRATRVRCYPEVRNSITDILKSEKAITKERNAYVRSNSKGKKK